MVKNRRGFTLIEVIIVILIIGIVAAFAIPSYQKYVVRTKRAEMQSEMIRIAQQLQSYITINHNYQNATLDKFGLTLVGTEAHFPSTSNLTYKLNLVVGNDNQTWTLTATPQGSQVGNGSVILNSNGWKCWTKTTTACTPSATSNWDGR